MISPQSDLIIQQVAHYFKLLPVLELGNEKIDYDIVSTLKNFTTIGQ